MEGGYPWHIDDTRSPHDTWPKIDKRSPSPHSEADFDMEGPHAPFVPYVETQAASKKVISTVQTPIYAQIAQTVTIQAQA